MNVAERKAELRTRILRGRNSISRAQWRHNSDAICDTILNSFEYRNSENIHCYISMNDRFEVDTHLLIKHLIKDGKQVIVPVANFKSGELSHSYLHSFDTLKANKWGVLEPIEVKPAEISSIDLILLPLLGVDRKGNRLGYGKGFYDRFLSQISIPTFGLIFDDFILDEIPTENFDIPLYGFISESGLFMCNNERNAS